MGNLGVQAPNDMDPKMAQNMMQNQMTQLFNDDDSKESEGGGFDTNSLINKIITTASKKLDGIDPVLP